MNQSTFVNSLAGRLAGTLLALAAPAAARADFIPISQPNAAYLGSTAKLDVPDSGPPVSSLTFGDLAITLSAPMNTLGHLSNWGTFPNVEDRSPPVIGFGVVAPSSRVLTFNEPLETFGLEMKYNLQPLFTSFNLTAQFFHGDTQVGTISRRYSSSTGALLFAATDVTEPFTSVRLSAPRDSWGFLIADVRVTAVPEPSGLALSLVGLAGAAGYAWRRRAGTRGRRGGVDSTGTD